MLFWTTACDVELHVVAVTYLTGTHDLGKKSI